MFAKLCTFIKHFKLKNICSTTLQKTHCLCKQEDEIFCWSWSEINNIFLVTKFDIKTFVCCSSLEGFLPWSLSTKMLYGHVHINVFAIRWQFVSSLLSVNDGVYWAIIFIILPKTCGREHTQNWSRLWLNLVKCKNLRIGTEYSKAITWLLKWIHVAFY